MDTARKIPEEGIVLLDELQSHLSRHGAKVSQKLLIVEGIKMLAENEERLLKRLKNRKDNTKEMTERFLKNAKRHNFGKNWLESIDVTL